MEHSGGVEEEKAAIRIYFIKNVYFNKKYFLYSERAGSC